MTTSSPQTLIDSTATTRTQERLPAERRAVVVVGGGITGLALGAWLARENADVLVLDHAATPGGVIDTVQLDGFRFERGPNTILSKHASFDALLAWAGLAGRALRMPLSAQPRHIWLNGKLHAAPAGLLPFLRSGLLPLRAKLALLREPFIAPVASDESIAALIERRLGPAWLRNLITPMLSGIWAGDPAQLSAEHALPLLKTLERDHGSLLRGAFARMRAARGAAPKTAPREMISFPDGLAELPRALAARLGENFRPHCAVDSVAPLPGGGFALLTRDAHGAQHRIETDHLVLTTPAHVTAGLLHGIDAAHDAASALRSVPHASLAIASVGIAADQARVPAGFGFLVPRGEVAAGQPVRILGAITPSNFLPGRAPAGCAALSVFIGGALDPTAIDLDDADLRALVQRDLARTIGLAAAPRVFQLQRWRDALPQYDMQHATRLAAYAAAEARIPGLHLAGNWRGGTALAERIEQARLLAHNHLIPALARKSGLAGAHASTHPACGLPDTLSLK